MDRPSHADPRRRGTVAELPQLRRALYLELRAGVHLRVLPPRAHSGGIEMSLRKLGQTVRRGMREAASRGLASG